MTFSLFAAFVAGFLSFISSSVVILIPFYVAFVAGGARKEGSLYSALSLVAAFSLMLIALGMSATTIGGFLSRYKEWLGMIAGGVLFVAGLHTTGVVKINVGPGGENRVWPTYGLEAVPVGIAFALGWTPVGGPILGSILTVGAAPRSVMTAFWLLTAYALGLAIPLVLTALAADQVVAAFDPERRYSRAIHIVSGTAMVVMGVLMLAGRFAPMARALSNYLPTF